MFIFIMCFIFPGFDGLLASAVRSELSSRQFRMGPS